jgi:hypothetical protein
MKIKIYLFYKIVFHFILFIFKSNEMKKVVIRNIKMHENVH